MKHATARSGNFEALFTLLKTLEIDILNRGQLSIGWLVYVKGTQVTDRK